MPSDPASLKALQNIISEVYLILETSPDLPQNRTARSRELTNGFSRKFENHWAALALYFAYYNFCRIHSSIRVTPAMESKITDHVWGLAELLG